MKSKLNIYTSYVSPATLRAIVDNDLLPIFIVRSIYNSQLIGRWSDTAIHFKILAPSDKLYQNKRDGKISELDFKKYYVIEMSKVNFQDIIKKLDNLANLSGAKGVVLMGYGSAYNSCHRKLLSELLNGSGLLENTIKELII